MAGPPAEDRHRGAALFDLTGEVDPVTGRVHTAPEGEARLRPGDLLIVDEAGMLDQDTARAVLTVADECQARLALLGDRHQLAAVGRGGVLDLAAAQVDPAARLTPESVHRFTHIDRTGQTVPDREYAELTLTMRRGDNPGAVFDALLARGRIRLHGSTPPPTPSGSPGSRHTNSGTLRPRWRSRRGPTSRRCSGCSGTPRRP